jgi:hypothetical protein
VPRSLFIVGFTICLVLQNITPNLKSKQYGGDSPVRTSRSMACYCFCIIELVPPALWVILVFGMVISPTSSRSTLKPTFQFPTIDNTNMADERTREVGSIRVPFHLQ